MMFGVTPGLPPGYDFADLRAQRIEIGRGHANHRVTQVKRVRPLVRHRMTGLQETVEHTGGHHTEGVEHHVLGFEVVPVGDIAEFGDRRDGLPAAFAPIAVGTRHPTDQTTLLKFAKDKDVDALRKRLIKANFFLYLILFGVCTFSKALVSVSESGEASIDDHSLYAADYLLKSLRHAGYCTCSLFSEITRLAPKERERFLADPVNKAALSLLASFFEGDLDSGLKRKEAIAFLMKEGLDEKKARKVLSRLVRAEILYKDGSSLYVGNDGTALYLVP